MQEASTQILPISCIYACTHLVSWKKTTKKLGGWIKTNLGGYDILDITLTTGNSIALKKTKPRL